MKAHESKSPALQAKKNTAFFSKKTEGAFFGAQQSTGHFFPGQQPAGHPIQTKLTVGQPNDVYEKEADSMADKVVQRLSESFNSVAPPLAQPAIQAPPTSLQPKCDHCAQEEKLQKEDDKSEAAKEKLQKKPIFESNADPPDDETIIQPKCAACAEKEKLQKKGEAGSFQTAPPQIESNLNSSKGKGSPLPDKTRAQMEPSFGSDLGKVRVHDYPAAAAMSKGLNAQAFTHGNDIYFNSGKYDPASRSGQHLLAHELTHTVQQGGGSTLRTHPQAPFLAPRTDKQNDYIEYSREVVEIKGTGTFDPSRGLGKYISSMWDDHQLAPVNIQFGNLAEGFIWIMPHDENYTETWYIPVGEFIVPVEVAPDTEDYEAPMQVIPFQHPDLDTEGKNGTPVLIVKIDQGVIWGRLGWIEGKMGNDINPKEDADLAGSTPDDFVKLVFGEEHAGKKFTPNGIIGYYNSLDHGTLDLFMEGDLDVDHQQKLNAAFLLTDGASKWSGALQTEIQGADPYDLPLDRTAQGYLSADTKGLRLNSNWTGKGKGFEVKGGLDISYAKGNLSVTGTASFKTDRANGTVTISLTDPETAEQLFQQHVPGRKADVPAQDSFLDTKLPAPDKTLALVAWGELHIAIVNTEDDYRLEGDVAFVVSPEGYIVTAGQVRFKKRAMLMKKLKRQWTLFEFSHHETAVVWVVPITATVKGKLTAGYDIGAIWFAEIMASGAYSNHPKYLSEFCLSGTFDMPAILNAKLHAEINVGAGIADYKILQAGFSVDGEAWVNAYVRATPSIGMEKKGNEPPTYCIGGKLYVGGEMKMGLSGNFEFDAIHLGEKDDKGNQEEEEAGSDKLHDMEWTIGDFGVEMKVDYTLGSDAGPEFSYSGKKFEEQAFKEAIAANDKHEEKGKKVEGGYKDDVEGDKKGKEEGHYSGKPFKPMHKDNEPLGTNAVTDSFNMNGNPHLLILTVTGAADAPQVKLEMQSERSDLMERLEEERSMYKVLLSTVHLTEKQERVAEQAILDLDAIKAEGIRIWDEALNLEANISQSDVDHLGDMITNYANRYGRMDLGSAAGQLPQSTGTAPAAPGTPPAAPGTPPATPGTPPAQPQAGPKIPPPGVEVELELPPQKSIHLRIYRDYVRRRLLEHSLQRPERDTEQIGQWTDNMGQRMRSEVKCLGVSLGLLRSGQPDPGREILRPSWTPRRRLGSNSAGDQLRMTVDHIIEYQLRSLSGGDWVDGPWNFELLEPSANSSAGSTLKNNIIRERNDLAQRTGDQTWTTADIQFTRVVAPAADRSTERYLEENIEDGDHLKDYQRLTGQPEDKDAYKDCMDRGGEPF